MNRNLSNILIFAVGAAIGSAVTWRFVKSKYEQIAQEEIDSVKEIFSRTADTHIRVAEEVVDVTEERSHITVEKPDIFKYAATIRENKYGDFAEKEEDYDIYVIAPEEYGIEDDYETESLTYYADKVLTDDQDIPIEDVENVVGLDFANHFGEYEDDSVFIRNEIQKTDYEILLDLRNYSDVVNRDPHPTEDE